jgi:hypothetical protein
MKSISSYFYMCIKKCYILKTSCILSYFIFKSFLFALKWPNPEIFKKGQEDHNVPEEWDFYS